MKTTSLPLLLVLSVASPFAWAADHGSHDHSAHAESKPAVSPAFAALDKNKDGYLSKAELAKHPMAGHFAMMDANKDGMLSPKEFASM